MWLWQRKNIHKRHLLWLKLFSVCFFIHCLFLSWVLFVDHDKDHTVSLCLHKHIDYTAPILFVPLSPLPIQQAHKTLTHYAASPSKTLTPTVPPVVPKLPQTDSANQKKVLEKIENKNSTTMTSKPLPATSIKKPTTPQIPTTSDKHSVDKKINTTSAATQQKQPTANKSTPQKTTEKLSIPENAHISSNYREVEAMRRTALLQKELINNWKPPFGVPATAACELQFIVDNQGSVKNITIIKSSGIMMYDIAAQHALFSITMPKWAYGKTITINFKQ